MLPEELSNGICSLNPKGRPLVMSALMEFGRGGPNDRFADGIRRNSLAERMTYTNVNKVLEGDKEMTARYSALVTVFAT